MREHEKAPICERTTKMPFTLSRTTPTKPETSSEGRKVPQGGAGGAAKGNLWTD